MTHVLTALMLAAEPNTITLEAPCDAACWAEIAKNAKAANAEPDAPKVVELTPTAHEARVEALTCKKDLADCEAKDRVEWKWIPIGVGAGVLAGVAIGLALGATLGKR